MWRLRCGGELMSAVTKVAVGIVVVVVVVVGVVGVVVNLAVVVVEVGQGLLRELFWWLW